MNLTEDTVTVNQSSYGYDVNGNVIPGTHTDGLSDLLVWAHQYMEDNFLFPTIPGTAQTAIPGTTQTAIPGTTQNVIPGMTQTEEITEHVAKGRTTPTFKTNLYASGDGTILTFQKSQHLVNMTAETGSILGEIQAYLLSRDVAQNIRHATSTTECNASEDKALPSKRSKIVDIGEFQTHEEKYGSDGDKQAIAHRHSRAGSLLRCLCGCGWPYPPKNENPTSGKRKRGILQRIQQLFKRK